MDVRRPYFAVVAISRITAKAVASVNCCTEYWRMRRPASARFGNRSNTI